MGIQEDLEQYRVQVAEVSGQRNELKRDLEFRNKPIEEKEKALYEQQKALIERIKKGESTGDGLLDFSVIHLFGLGLSKDEQIQQLRDLQSTINSNGDSPVLVLNQAVENYGPFYMFPGPNQREPMFGISSKLRLGIIQGGLEFNIGAGNLTIPTTTHLRRESRDHDILRWYPEQGPITLDSHSLTALGNRLGNTGIMFGNTGLRQFDHGLMIYTGEEVEEWFRKGGREDSEQLLRRARKQIADPSYFLALSLLDREAPDEFREAYIETIRPNAEKILEAIDNLRLKEKAILGKIQEIKGKSRNGKLTLNDGERFSTYDSDKYIASDVKHLEGVREKIIANLRGAIGLRIPQLGLDENGYFAAHCKAYDVEISLE